MFKHPEKTVLTPGKTGALLAINGVGEHFSSFQYDIRKEKRKPMAAIELFKKEKLFDTRKDGAC